MYQIDFYDKSHKLCFTLLIRSDYVDLIPLNSYLIKIIFSDNSYKIVNVPKEWYYSETKFIDSYAVIK